MDGLLTGNFGFGARNLALQSLDIFTKLGQGHRFQIFKLGWFIAGLVIIIKHGVYDFNAFHLKNNCQNRTAPYPKKRMVFW